MKVAEEDLCHKNNFKALVLQANRFGVEDDLL
jgi:hypothetical protein